MSKFFFFTFYKIPLVYLNILILVNNLGLAEGSTSILMFYNSLQTYPIMIKIQKLNSQGYTKRKLNISRNNTQVFKQYQGIFCQVDKSGITLTLPEAVREFSSQSSSDIELNRIHSTVKPKPCFFTELQQRCWGTTCK